MAGRSIDMWWDRTYRGCLSPIRLIPMSLANHWPHQLILVSLANLDDVHRVGLKGLPHERVHIIRGRRTFRASEVGHITVP